MIYTAHGTRAVKSLRFQLKIKAIFQHVFLIGLKISKVGPWAKKDRTAIADTS